MAAPRSRSVAGPTPRREVRVLFVASRPPVEDAFGDEFQVLHAEFAGATAAADREQPDVVVVDVSEGHRHMDVARIAHAGTRRVVVLGPPDDPAEAMRYLDLGASDYMSWRTATIERVARIRAMARTSGGGRDSDAVRFGSVTVSLRRQEVRRNGEPIRLTPNEFRLLDLLIRRADRIVSHRELIAHVWGPELLTARDNLRVYIRQLREKLEDDPNAPQLIITEWSLGYRLRTGNAADTPVAVSA